MAVRYNVIWLVLIENTGLSEPQKQEKNFLEQSFESYCLGWESMFFSFIYFLFVLGKQGYILDNNFLPIF